MPKRSASPAPSSWETHLDTWESEAGFPSLSWRRVESKSSILTSSFFSPDIVHDVGVSFPTPHSAHARVFAPSLLTTPVLLAHSGPPPPHPPCKLPHFAFPL